MFAFVSPSTDILPSESPTRSGLEIIGSSPRDSLPSKLSVVVFEMSTAIYCMPLCDSLDSCCCFSVGSSNEEAEGAIGGDSVPSLPKNGSSSILVR